MNEHDLNNVVELTDEQLDAISGGYIVDLSEHHGSDYFALVDDDTGKVIGYSNARHFLEGYEAAKVNSIEVISMSRYEEIFGRKFYS